MLFPGDHSASPWVLSLGRPPAWSYKAHLPPSLLGEASPSSCSELTPYHTNRRSVLAQHQSHLTDTLHYLLCLPRKHKVSSVRTGLFTCPTHGCASSVCCKGPVTDTYKITNT